MLNAPVTRRRWLAVLLALLLVGLKFRDSGSGQLAAQASDDYDPLEDDD